MPPASPSLPERPEVLIVGAGPTGLAAALFLAGHGIRARLVERADRPAITSRAQVVNPRSLELLAASGVAADILREARPVHGVRFTEGWKPLAALEFSGLRAAHPMSVLPQARTEALLQAALAGHGVRVERGVTFQDLMQDAHGVVATLLHEGGGRETIQVPLLLGADGAHSAVRAALGIGFPGRTFPESWPLYDIELNDPLDLDHAHVEFAAAGLVFMLAIRPGLWRVFGNLRRVLELLPPHTRAGAVMWESEFHIADRLAEAAAEGRVALAGDAAHIHSPVGARGMNLGIEDAFVFAACAAGALRGRPELIAEYGYLRHQVHRLVVARMDRLTALARGRPGWVGLLRRMLIPGMTGFGPAAHVMRDFVTGLDQPVRLPVEG